MSLATCYQHDDEAVGSCFSCLKPICHACSTMDRLTTLCPPCAAEARKARRKRNNYTGFGIAAACAVAVVGFTFLEAPYDYGERAAEVKKLKAALEREPCDRRKIIDLAEAMNAAGDYRGAVQRSEAFFEQCGELPRLRWATYHARKQLSEHPEAIVEATKLIEDDPADQDYRWWRGEIYERMGEYEAAAEDYAACIDNLPSVNHCPFRLADMLEKLGRACEGKPVIEQYLRYHPEHRGHRSVQSHMRRLERHGCVIDAEGGE